MKLKNYIEKECVNISGYFLCDIVIYDNKLRAQIFDFYESGKITLLNYSVHVNDDGKIFIKVAGQYSKKNLDITEYITQVQQKIVYEFHQFSPEDKKIKAEERYTARKICEKWLEKMPYDKDLNWWNIGGEELDEFNRKSIIKCNTIRNYMKKKWLKNMKIKKIDVYRFKKI